MFDGGGVVLFDEAGFFVGCAGDKDDAGDVEPVGAERADGEEGVVDGSKAGAGGDQNRKFECLHQVEHGFALVKRNHDAACAFGNHKFVF